MIFLKCHFTVSSVTCRRAAISLLLRPSAAFCRTPTCFWLIGVELSIFRR